MKSYECLWGTFMTGKHRLLSSEPADQARLYLHRFSGNTPDIYLIGETSFLLPRLWETFFQTQIRSQLSLGKVSQSLKHEWRDLSWFSYWQEILNRDLSRIPDLSVIQKNLEWRRFAQLLRGRPILTPSPIPNTCNASETRSPSPNPLSPTIKSSHQKLT
jgi:hypothetical protein